MNSFFIFYFFCLNHLIISDIIKSILVLIFSCIIINTLNTIEFQIEHIWFDKYLITNDSLLIINQKPLLLIEKWDIDSLCRVFSA